MLRVSRILPDKMPFPERESCVDWMKEAWSDPALHVQARNGYKLTGATNALDGSEDDLIARDARVFWDKLGVYSTYRDLPSDHIAINVLEFNHEDDWKQTDNKLHADLIRLGIREEHVAGLEAREFWINEKHPSWFLCVQPTVLSRLFRSPLR